MLSHGRMVGSSGEERHADEGDPRPLDPLNSSRGVMLECGACYLSLTGIFAHAGRDAEDHRWLAL